LNAKYILITLGEGGSVLFEKGKEQNKLLQKHVRLETFRCWRYGYITLTVALVAGAEIYEAAFWQIMRVDCFVRK
jgi:hypothetical protein